jgi:hypothetical protein
MNAFQYPNRSCGSGLYLIYYVDLDRNLGFVKSGSELEGRLQEWATFVPVMVTTLFLVPGAYTPFLDIWIVAPASDNDRWRS